MQLMGANKAGPEANVAAVNDLVADSSNRGTCGSRHGEILTRRTLSHKKK